MSTKFTYDEGNDWLLITIGMETGRGGEACLEVGGPESDTNVWWDRYDNYLKVALNDMRFSVEFVVNVDELGKWTEPEYARDMVFWMLQEQLSHQEWRRVMRQAQKGGEKLGREKMRSDFRKLLGAA